MLLRSSSSPILNSWIPTMAKDASPEFIPTTLPLARSVSFAAASPSADSPLHKLTRTLSEIDLRDPQPPPQIPKWRHPAPHPPIPVEESNEEEAESPRSSAASKLDRLLSSSGLDELVSASAGLCPVEVEEKVLVSCGIFGGGGGAIFGGSGRGGNGGSGDGDGGFEFSNNGHESMDFYYRKMIDSDPSNSLLLTNYAKFLKDVRGDVVKAEEYAARSILASPGDGDVLSLYGNLVWESSRDAERAETYFDQAVRSAPDNCYVMASYANFLWDAEEEEENGEKQEGKASSIVQEAAPHHRPPPLAAAS